MPEEVEGGVVPNKETPFRQGSGPSGPFMVPVYRAAERLGVSEEEVQQMITSGELETKWNYGDTPTHVTPDSVFRAMARQEAVKVMRESNFGTGAV